MFVPLGDTPVKIVRTATFESTFVPRAELDLRTAPETRVDAGRSRVPRDAEC